MNAHKWILVAGARPNFMKIAPLLRAIQAHNEINDHGIQSFLVHTGQHYDDNMSDSFFRDLDIPKPDVHLGVGSGTHGEQTGKVLIEFEKVLLEERPNLVIVVGDVNSTLACALAAVKLHIQVAHVEAGLRSFDRKMPEEINRILTDAVSDYLFTPSPDGDQNLLKEGISPHKIHLVGDIMVDSLMFHLEQAKKSLILHRLGLINSQSIHETRGSSADHYPLTTNHCPSPTTSCPRPSAYCLLTLHRPSNVDGRDTFMNIVSGLTRVASRIPVLFPVHPRTRKQIRLFNMEENFEFHSTPELSAEDYSEGNGLKPIIHCLEPLSYLDFLNLMAHARVVLTDSGGIQEETTALNIPCITLRDTTERPITLTEGTNVLVHNDPEKIVSEVSRVLDGKRGESRCPPIWDGHTAERIVRILAEKVEGIGVRSAE